MKKILTLLFMAVALLLAACSSDEAKQGAANTKTINLGIQQTLSPLWVAKEKGWLEEAFDSKGVKINWTEFQSGPPQFEGIAAGKLDITEVGNTPPLTGQAANIAFKEIALLSNGETNNAIILPKGSTVKSTKDLEGKKVAVAKGSSAYGLLYAALEKDNVDPNDLEIIQLQPDEAQPAFENGSVDAWATWEPFISYQTITNEATPLLKGEDVGTYGSMFTIASTKFIEQNGELTTLYLEVYKKATDWVASNPEEAAQFFSELRSIDLEVTKEILRNSPYEMQVISDKIIASQQGAADLFVEQKVFNNKIDVKEVVDNQFIEKVLKGAE